MRLTRTLVTLAYAASGIVLAGVGYFLLVDSADANLFLVGDDAGYYFGIARNFCLGYGISFDRIHETNGFNPLYEALLILSYRTLLSDFAIDDCYRIGVALSYILVLLSCGLWVAISRRFVSAGGLAEPWRGLVPALCLVFYVFFVCLKSYYGMDAAMVLFLGNAYLLRVQRGGFLAPGLRHAGLDGMLLGLLCLARLDSLPLVASAYLVMLLASPRTGCTYWRWVQRLGTTLVVVAPYVILAYGRFGTWVPISAQLKDAFPEMNLHRSLETITGTSLNLVDQLSFGIALLVSSLLSCSWLATLLRGQRIAALSGPRNSFLGLMSFYLAARLTYMLLFSRLDVQGSYAILAHGYNVLVFIALVEWLAHRFPGRQGNAILAVSFAGLMLLSVALLGGKWVSGVPKLERARSGSNPSDVVLGRAIHDLTTPGDILFGGAFGVMGFFSDRSWVNADGVANSYDYQECFVGGGLRRYLEENRVTHVVFSARSALREHAPVIRVGHYSPLYERREDLVLDESDIIYRSGCVRRGDSIFVARFESGRD